MAFRYIWQEWQSVTSGRSGSLLHLAGVVVPIASGRSGNLLHLAGVVVRYIRTGVAVRYIWQE